MNPNGWVDRIFFELNILGKALKLGLAIVADKSSKFSNLLVLTFMKQSTVRKVHPRNSVCRLCGDASDAFESRHLLRVFGRAGKAGSGKNFASRIRNVRGISITESDSLSTLI